MMMDKRYTKATTKQLTIPKRSLCEIGADTGIELTEQELTRVSGGRNNKYGKHQTGFN
jgi:hypothetical protein